MIIAALVISVTASIGTDTNFYQVETWKGPTESDLTTCATMARDMNREFDYLISKGLNTDFQTKTATCEIHVED